MQSKLIILSISLMLSSCNTYYWTSKTKPSTALEGDTMVCQRQALRAFPRRMQYTSRPTYVTSTTGHGPHGLTIDTSSQHIIEEKDSNEDLREESFQHCMEHAGWKRKKRA
jgi:hypothetical protein